MSLQNKKRGLGRGLDAILQSPETDITSSDISGNYVAGAVAEINIDFIEANPFQPRTTSTIPKLTYIYLRLPFSRWH